MMTRKRCAKSLLDGYTIKESPESNTDGSWRPTGGANWYHVKAIIQTLARIREAGRDSFTTKDVLLRRPSVNRNDVWNVLHFLMRKDFIQKHGTTVGVYYTFTPSGIAELIKGTSSESPST